MKWRCALPLYSERELNDDLAELVSTGQAVTYTTPDNDYEITFVAPENAWRLDAAGRQRMPVAEAMRRLRRLDN
jgi:hypothetical protein